MTGDNMYTNCESRTNSANTTNVTNQIRNFRISWQILSYLRVWKYLRLPKSLVKSYTKRTTQGFTLIETLVALTLISVVITIGTDLFFTFQRLSQRTEALESMVSSSRFIVERVAREVREGTIDYTRFTLPIVGAQNTLYLLNSAGEPFNFAYNGDTNDLILTVASGSESLTSAGVNIRNLAFYIFPNNDPFTFDRDLGDFAADEQPRVTLFISLDNNLPVNDRNYVRYDVQTTISSRTYLR